MADAAFLELLHKTQEGRLMGFFRRRLDSREAAADATQEVFLRMLSVPSAAEIENPQAYLFQVARSVARVVLLRQRQESALFTPEDQGLYEADDAPLPDRVVDARQRLRLMAAAIEALPRRCQQVFILSRLHGLPNGEIAARLGISRNMVEKHIIKALLHCRRVRDEIS